MAKKLGDVLAKALSSKKAAPKRKTIEVKPRVEGAPTDITWKYEIRPTNEITEWKDNPRKLSREGLAQLADSIRDFGLPMPIVINTDGLICGGHGRMNVLRKMKVKAVYCAVPSRTLTMGEFRELNIRLNKNIAGDFDMKMLAENYKVEELLKYGFSHKDLEGFAAQTSAGLCDENDVPEAPSKPCSRSGDLWILGNHRLLCGDATSATDVERLLGKVKPHLMVTDPPYGVEYNPQWRDDAAKNSPSMGNRKDTAKGKVTNDSKADWREAWALFPGNIAYVWHADKYSPKVAESLESCGFILRNMIVWAKSHLVISRGDYHHQHEPCWYAVKGTGNWAGDRKQTTLWQINKPQKSETGHGTQKPVDCMKRPIENNSSMGQAVYDPFLGSGTTLIAAEMTSRHCFGTEIDPAYCDVIVSRWQNYTGKDAVLESNSKTFVEMMGVRKVKVSAKVAEKGKK